jgi:hypothetical protein
MTVLTKSALLLSAAAVLALSGCSTSSGGSRAATASTATTQLPAPNASGATKASETKASDGSSSSAPAASAPLHACVLVGEQDATTALGADPGVGKEDTQNGDFGGNSTCVYAVPAGGIQVTASSIAGKALCDGSRKSNSVDVLGIGDKAFETADTSASREDTVYVIKGATCLIITIEAPASAGSAKPLVVALAKNAAGRV